MKLPLHEILFVKATAPLICVESILLFSLERGGLPRTTLRSPYGSMMLKGLVPVIGNWFIFSIISVSSSALPSTLTACATVS